MTKTYSGELDATGHARVLTAQGEDGRAYVAIERVTGSLAGRTGTFVLSHAAHEGDMAPGIIVPGSGTGELAGISGEVALRHDDDGARLELRYTL